jgi:apolipoprotein D and lipocalin family protein
MRQRTAATAAAAAIFALAAIGVTVVATRRSLSVGNANVPPPGKPVNLSKYLGLWYEIGRYDNDFERGLEGVTAEYRVRADGLIRIFNTGRRRSPTGRARVAQGWAKVVAGSDNAKLKVSFFGPLYVGNYWILDHADDYDWSIVGEPSGRFLWLLSRRPYLSPEDRSAIYARARELGYDTDLIRRTVQ